MRQNCGALRPHGKPHGRHVVSVFGNNPPLAISDSNSAREAPVTKRHLLAESEYVRMAPRSGRGVCGGLPRITELNLTFI